MRSRFIVPISITMAIAATAVAQPPAPPARPGGPPPMVTEVRLATSDRPSTSPGEQEANNQLLVNLRNGVEIQQLLSFITEHTGKPVIKDPEVQGKITVVSKDKLTRDDAVQLIFQALELSGVAVIESPREIMLVNAEKAKTTRIQMLGIEDSAASITNRAQMVQKIFKLTTTTPKSIEAALRPLIGKQGSIGSDERTKSIILTDTAANMQRFEQIVRAFDRVEAGQMDLQVLKLQHANADELAEILATMAIAGEGGNMQVQQRSSSYDYYSRARRGGGRVAGDVVVIPDVRTNWIILVGPTEKVKNMLAIAEQLDVPGRTDVQVYVIKLEHTDAFDLSEDIRDMLRMKMMREKQEVFEVRASSSGNQLIVMATPEMYKMVEELVKQLDTIEAVERETRTFELKYMDANDMSEQLSQLYEGDLRGGYSIFGYGYGYGRGGGSSRNQPRFVPSTRTNSIMILAQPNEYEFIEKMIHELDIPIPEENIAPRVFHIVHTDAAEMVRVLTELFQGASQRRSTMPDFFGFRPQRSAPGEEIGALYGKVRFVVYTNTNSIVVITNNAANFPIVERLVKDLDVLDPEATNMLVVQLQFADAAEVANHINNLLSDGPVSRPGGTARPPQQGGGGGNQNQEEQRGLEEEQIVDVVFPWQSGQRRQLRPGEEERPISSLIGHIRIVPDTRSQKLICAAPSIYFDSLKTLIEEIDQPEPQVQLETYIVRIDATDEKRIGWRWTPGSVPPEELENAFVALSDMGFADTFDRFRTDPTFEWRERGDNDFLRVTPGGQLFQPLPIPDTRSFGRPAKGVLSTEVNLTLLLQLLIRNANAQVEARPQVTVNNNERGEIFVGENVPFEQSVLTGATGGPNLSQNTQVEYREVGTRLEITPAINREGRVVLRIFVEHSGRKPETINGRLITDRQTYTTKLTVEDNQTVWLGGLTQQRLDNVVRKVPILGQIPVLGYLFRKSDKVAIKSVLYTFVTPRVLESSAEIREQYVRARQGIKEAQEGSRGPEIELPDVIEDPGSGATTQTLEQPVGVLEIEVPQPRPRELLRVNRPDRQPAAKPEMAVPAVLPLPVKEGVVNDTPPSVIVLPPAGVPNEKSKSSPASVPKQESKSSPADRKTDSKPPK